MNDYTPTTEEVRAQYASNPAYPYRGGYPRNKGEEFDRWLESLLATAGADTLREALKAMIPDGAYADSNRAEAEGDYVGQAYHEGLHDAWAAVNDLLIRADSMEGKAHD